MSDRWDFIEKEMDADFQRKMELNKAIIDNQTNGDKLFMKKYCRWMSEEEIDNSSFAYNQVNDIWTENKIKFHQLKKKLRKLWYNIFKC